MLHLRDVCVKISVRRILLTKFNPYQVIVAFKSYDHANRKADGGRTIYFAWLQDVSEKPKKFVW